MDDPLERRKGWLGLVAPETGKPHHWGLSMSLQDLLRRYPKTKAGDDAVTTEAPSLRLPRASLDISKGEEGMNRVVIKSTPCILA